MDDDILKKLIHPPTRGTLPVKVGTDGQSVSRGTSGRRNSDRQGGGIHDLSGSMSVISGFLKTLDVQRLSDEDREFHAAAVRGVERVLGMIEDVGKKLYSYGK